MFRPTPLADAMFQQLGVKLDEAGAAERAVLDHLEQALWSGDWLQPEFAGSTKTPLHGKQRLETLLAKTIEIRHTYQTRLADNDLFKDKNFDRSLTPDETMALHNAWMNDVAAWMNEECLTWYTALQTLAEQSERKGKGGAAKPGDSKAGKQGGKAAKHGGSGAKTSVTGSRPTVSREVMEAVTAYMESGGKAGKPGGKAGKPGSMEARKGKGGAAKPADSAGKPGGKAEKHGPRQEAQQLKKQRFNKVISDIAANKAFFMSFIRYPCMRTVDGFGLLLNKLAEMKATPAYQKIFAQSQKRSAERTQLKRKRDKARVNLRKGKRYLHEFPDSELAKKYWEGELARECDDLEVQYNTKKHEGLAQLIGDRLHDEPSVLEGCEHSQ